MNAWQACLPPLRRRVTGGGGLRLRASLNLADFLRFQLTIEHQIQAFFRGAGSPLQHQSPVGTLLPVSPALLEHPKSTRLSPTGDPAPQVQLWRDSPLCRSITSGRERPTGGIFPRITLLLLGGGRRKSDAGKAYIC
jgi:hypothetical protein